VTAPDRTGYAGFPRAGLPLLRCIADGGELRLGGDGPEEPRLWSGILRCVTCGRDHPIVEGIVEMLDEAQLAPESQHELRERDERGDLGSALPPGGALPLADRVELADTLAFLQPDGGALLELGCGTGRLTPAFGRRFRFVLAVDFARRSLTALARGLRPGDPVGLVRASILRLGVAPRAFSRVFTATSLVDREQRMAMHRAAAEALADGGRYVTGSEYFGLRPRLLGLPRTTRYQPGGVLYRHMDRDEMIRQIAPYFERVRASPIKILPLTGRLGASRAAEWACRAFESVPVVRELGDLILASGERPIRPSAEGEETPGVALVKRLHRWRERRRRATAGRDELRVEVLRSREQLAPLKSEIDALNLASRRPCPFASFEFLDALLRHDESAAPEDELLFLAAFRGDRLAGYLPLRRRRARLLGLPFHHIECLALHTGDRPHTVARAEDEVTCSAAFHRHLLDRDGRWSSIVLASQDEGSGLLVAAPPTSRRRYVRRFENAPNSTIPLPHGSLAAYYATLERDFRKRVARRVRRLLEAGEISVITSGDPLAREALLDLYLDVERRSWKGSARVGIARHPERVALFRGLCERDQPLALSLHLVTWNGAPIAGQISGAFQGACYALETAYDAAFADVSPGYLLHLFFMRHAIQAGLRSCNLLHEYAYYKSSWNGVATPTVALQIFRTPGLPHLKARLGALRRRLLPSAEAPVDFNPARRAVEQQAPEEAPARPSRSGEAARAEAVLARLQAEGAALERLAGAALLSELPFPAEAQVRGRRGTG
jgi:CelD/BcsL family acetyltransferase involved in cellulose biosynthesis/ubiquinone/menaquinone biosynthesis C-methylase UbiE/uncharacterized protein YbaR (Trm112 family)